jgi:hypothetical protein
LCRICSLCQGLISISPAGFVGEAAIVGTLSVDGEDHDVQGAGVMVFGTGSPPRGAVVRLEESGVRFRLEGPMNAVVTIEVAGGLDSPIWEVLTEFRLTQPGQTWNVPGGASEQARFYRVTLSPPDTR